MCGKDISLVMEENEREAMHLVLLLGGADRPEAGDWLDLCSLAARWNGVGAEWLAGMAAELEEQLEFGSERGGALVVDQMSKGRIRRKFLLEELRATGLWAMDGELIVFAVRDIDSREAYDISSGPVVSVDLLDGELVDKAFLEEALSLCGGDAGRMSGAIDSLRLLGRARRDQGF